MPRPVPCPVVWAAQLRPLYEASLNKFYIDEFYEWLVVKPTGALAVVCEFLDVYVVDRLVIGLALLPRLFGRTCWPPFRMA